MNEIHNGILSVDTVNVFKKNRINYRYHKRFVCYHFLFQKNIEDLDLLNLSQLR